MRSYGTISIQNSIYVPHDFPSLRERRSASRYSEEIRGALAPVRTPSSSNLNTFVIDLFYSDYKYVYKQGGRPYSTALTVEYDKKIKRVSSSKDILNEAANLVSTYSSCNEAKKLKKRMVALSRLKNSISDEVFRFSTDS